MSIAIQCGHSKILSQELKHHSSAEVEVRH